jgi:RND family efflux transporter MFP subunit
MGLGARLGVVGFLAGCGRSAPVAEVPIPVRVEPVQAVEGEGAHHGAAYLAMVRGRDQVTLSFKVGGILTRVGPESGDEDWQEGAVVRQGDLLAWLHPNDFLTASNSAAAQAQLDRTQFERAERLLSSGAASQQEYDRAQAAMRASAAELELRSQMLLDSRIRAPFDGTILGRHVNAGETVAPGKPVLTLAKLDEVEVEVGVPDRLVSRLTAGMEGVALLVPALGDKEFRGRIQEVGVAAREGTRLFRVLIRVDNRDGQLRPGMAASVFLDDGTRVARGLQVPLSALVARGERELAVFVVTNGVAKERRIETGDLVQSRVVVTRGLSEGEAVVVAGASLLHEGAKVVVREEGAAGRRP